MDSLLDGVTTLHTLHTLHTTLILSFVLLNMNTASKLGPHTQTDRGTCPGVGL